MSRVAAAMVAAVLCMTPSIARTDSGTDRDRAEALFEEGKGLRGQRRYLAACADFEALREV